MLQRFNFPTELKTTISGLRNEKQWTIIEELINNDNELPYSTILDNLSHTQKGDLNYHLNELERSGWLQNIVKSGNDVSDKYSSYYMVTKFGLKILEGAMQAMNTKSYEKESMGFFHNNRLGGTIWKISQESGNSSLSSNYEGFMPIGHTREVVDLAPMRSGERKDRLKNVL